MNRHAHSPSNARVALSITILICLVAFAPAAWPSEGGARSGGGLQGEPHNGWKLVKKSSRANEPIRIIWVKSKAGEIEPGKRFKGGAT